MHRLHIWRNGPEYTEKKRDGKSADRHAAEPERKSVLEGGK